MKPIRDDIDGAIADAVARATPESRKALREVLARRLKELQAKYPRNVDEVAEMRALKVHLWGMAAAWHDDGYPMPGDRR